MSKAIIMCHCSHFKYTNMCPGCEIFGWMWTSELSNATGQRLPWYWMESLRWREISWLSSICCICQWSDLFVLMQYIILLHTIYLSLYKWHSFLCYRGECRGECQCGSTSPHSEAWVLRSCPERRGWQWSFSCYRRGHQNIRGPCKGWAEH